MVKTIAVINQKGGVGKTTTAMHFGIGLRRMGYKVLLIDMDPQCNLSYAVGGEFDNGKTVLEVIDGSVPAGDAVQRLSEIDLIPGSSSLSSLGDKYTENGREFRLKDAISPIKNLYDFVIIDGPPALGLITVSILTACNSFIITAAADIFSVQGIGQLYGTYSVVQNFCNKELKIDGVLLTKHTDRFLHNRSLRQQVEEIAAEIDTKVFKTSIREAVVVREAQTNQQSLFKFAPRSKPAQDYDAFIKEYLRG